MKLRTAVLAAFALLFGAYGTAFAHTALVRAEPGKNAKLATCPTRVLLVFSEPLEPALARIDLDGAKLASAGDPHDVHAVLAPLVTCPSAGAHKVTWHVVSADGHAVNGTYSFTVDSAAAPAPAPTVASVVTPPPPVVSDTSVTEPVPVAPDETPVVAALLRGLALTTLMALAGLLFFRDAKQPMSIARLDVLLAFVAPLLLAAHLMAWMMNADAAHHMNTAALGTTPGRIEMWRLGLAVLALWALILARRPKLAMLFAVAALALSGALGHPAAIHPEGTIAAKAFHLVAGAAWLGGLLHLVTLPRSDSGAFSREAARVSGIALWSVVLVVLSGVIQWRYFLPTVNLLGSGYGTLMLVKIVGLLVLVAFGAHHKFRVLPKLEAAGRFNTTLRLEIAVMVVVALVGGLLAYTSPPTLP